MAGPLPDGLKTVPYDKEGGTIQTVKEAIFIDFKKINSNFN